MYTSLMQIYEINNDIINLYSRDFLHREMVRNPTNNVVNEFKYVRKQTNVKMNNEKKDYFNNLYEEGTVNIKTLWSELSKLFGKTNGVVDSCLTADQFNTHFCNIGKNITSHFPDDQEFLWKGPSNIYDFKLKDVAEDSVLTLLKCLSLSSSHDVLNFDCKLLRLSCFTIVKHLTYMFNLTFSKGCVPNDWKLARVTPIYKDCGDINDATNYRPRSVIGYIAKILEKDV